VTRRVEDFAENMEQQLKDEVKDFTYFSLALDESSDACDTRHNPRLCNYRGACFSAVNEEHNHREIFIGGG
jgi:hypothetical protein